MNDYYNEKIKWLELNYSEFSPTEYYRMMFPNGSFQKPKESNGDYKPNGILQFRCKGEEKGKMHSRIINDDHKTIDDCLEGNDEYKNIDFAISKIDDVNTFLCQSTEEKFDFDEITTQLFDIFSE